MITFSEWGKYCNFLIDDSWVEKTRSSRCGVSFSQYLVGLLMSWWRKLSWTDPMNRVWCCLHGDAYSFCQSISLLLKSLAITTLALLWHALERSPIFVTLFLLLSLQLSKCSRTGDIGFFWLLGITSVMRMSCSFPATEARRSSLLLKNWPAFV